MSAKPPGADSRDSLPPANSIATTVARARRKVAGGVALLSFLLYLSCLSPTVTYSGDCGELIAASYRLGITHPTGYALLCLLGRTFASVFPVGEIAFRYNLLSAILSSLAVGLVAASVHRLTVGTDAQRGPDAKTLAFHLHCPAIAAGLLLAGFYEFWTQAIIAEVSGLEAITEAAALYCAIAWHQEEDFRWAYTAALCFGLAIISHLTSIFLFPGLILYVLWQHRRGWQSPAAGHWRRLATVAALPMLAYSLMIYLPLRSSLFPEPVPANNWNALDWTHPVDLHRFLLHVSAQQYKVHLIKWTPFSLGGLHTSLPSFVAPLATLPSRLKGFFSEIWDLYLWSTPFVFAGVWLSFAPRLASGPDASRRTGGRWLGWMLGLTAVLNVGMEINYEVADQTNFFFPAYICMAIWLGLGLAWAFGCLERWGDRLDAGKTQPVWHWRCTAFAWTLYLATAIISQWSIFYGVVSMHGDTFARDAAMERAVAAQTLTASTGKTPTLFLMGDDALWGFWYVHFVLRQPAGAAGDRASPVVTPYGLYRNKMDNSGQLVDFIAQAQKTGPVAISKFENSVDEKFPYQIISPSGNLCLASTRALPEPARPMERGELAPVGPNGLIAAFYQRSALACGKVTDAHQLDMTGYSQDAIDFVIKHKVVSLKGDDLAAFEFHFLCTDAMRRSMATGPRDNAAHAARAAWIEVLMAKHGFLKGVPPPDQPDIRLEDADIPLRVWRQRRRIVLPDNARAGSAWTATVPLQIEAEAVTSGYTAWSRIITDPHDTTTPWGCPDRVFVTQQ